jgi:hypothetical protein
MRTSEPVSTGMPTSRPNCVSESPRSALIFTPTIEKIVHTAKHTVKATVDRDRARVAAGPSAGSAAEALLILRSMVGVGWMPHSG